jgi:hypothetical protein
MAIGRSRIEYHVLRGLGATPEEALCALLEAGYQDPPSLAFILAVNLPGNLRADRLGAILERYSIHPLSLALHLNDRRRALRILGRLGVLSNYGHWLKPWGLDIHDEPDLQELPAGLVIDGDARIEDCPQLVDLGENLVVTGGTLLVRRCGALKLLPDGLTTYSSGHITLIDCPRVEHLGARTNIEGVLFVEGCPRFKDQHLVKRHKLEE